MARAAQRNSASIVDDASLQPRRPPLNTLFPPFPGKREPDMAFDSSSSHWGQSLDATNPSFPQMRETAEAGSSSFPHKPASAGARSPSFPLARESIFAGPAGEARTNSRSSLSHALPLIRGAACLLLGILLFLLLSTTIAAAENGVITGTVINGTEDGSAPADVAVTLYYLRNGEIVEQRTQVTDAAGVYRFTEISTEPSLTFVVVAAYGQVPYNSPELQFAESTEIQAPPLTVFEASQDASVVRVVTDVLFVAPGEEGSGMLGVIEVVRLANDSDRTYLATGVAGGGAPMNVLRFALPADAEDLTMLSGLNAQNVVQIDRGFGVFMPLLPGEREVAFGYQIPYSGSTLELNKRTVYPTDHFAILALEEHALQFNSSQLEVHATPIGDRRYLVGAANSLTARADVSVQVAGLPAPSLQVRFERLFARVRAAQATFFILLGLILVLPVLYAVYRMRGGLRRRVARTSAVAVAAPDAQEALLLEIAQLDDDFAAGGLAEDEYRQLRADKKQRLLELYGEPGSEADDG